MRHSSRQFDRLIDFVWTRRLQARAAAGLVACAILSVGALLISTSLAGDGVPLAERQRHTSVSDNDVIVAGLVDKIQEIKDLLEPGVLGSWGHTLEGWMGGYGPDEEYLDIEAHAAAMADFYNEPQLDPLKNGATLLPTVSYGVWTSGPIAINCNDPIVKHIPNYFMCKFLHRKPELKAVTSHNVELLGVDNNGNEFASNQGLYTFHLHADGNGNDIVDGMGAMAYEEIFARFTFVYKKQGDGPWTPDNTKIIQHHSSVEPGLAPPPAKEQQIKDLLTKWGNELKKWDYGMPGNYVNADAHANGMAALYAADAVLLPTVKPGVWTPGALAANCLEPIAKKIPNYFRCAFLCKQPKMVSVDQQFVVFSPDLKMAANQGLYTFELKVRNLAGVEVRALVPARFTFVYRKGNLKDWSDAKIIMHHSSGSPSCTGDLTGPEDAMGIPAPPNGVVDWDDVLKVLDNWGACPVPCP